MNSDLGNKIKKARKQKKLTQTELGGDNLSKGTLSLIENNLTTPSIKTLKYIAERLEMPLSYFIDDKIKATSSVEDIIFQKTTELKNMMLKEENVSAIEFVSDFLNDNILDNSIVSADAYINFAHLMLVTKNYDKYFIYLEEASFIYATNNMYIYAAEAILATLRPHLKFDKTRYETIIGRAEKLYEHSLVKDKFFEIELILHKIIYSTIYNRDYKHTLNLFIKAINLSRANNLYCYDDILSYKIYFCITNHKFAEYRDEAYDTLKLCRITNSPHYYSNLLFVASGENQLTKGNEALELLRELEDNINSADQITKNHMLSYLFETEYAWSYYIVEDYKKALEHVEKIDFKKYQQLLTADPERILFWKNRIGSALILSKSNKSSEAISLLNTCINQLKDFSQPMPLYLAYSALAEVLYINNNYQEAYQASRYAAEYLLQENYRVN